MALDWNLSPREMEVHLHTVCFGHLTRHALATNMEYSEHEHAQKITRHPTAAI